MGAATAGERAALARLISIIETGGQDADEVQRALFDSETSSYVVGVTGAPGAGKSTLVGALIRFLRAHKERVAVLAVDPSSPFSKGALLGDRLRMTTGERDPGVFIRSMASRGQQGGLAASTLAAALVLEACGWPLVIIETVGVGQAEVDVAGAADTTVVVLSPGWGDEVQTHKAGLMEIGDVFVINKADREGVGEARAELQASLSSRATAGAEATIVETVATENKGIEELWRQLCDRRRLRTPQRLQQRRTSRIGQVLEMAIKQRLVRRLDQIVGSAAFTAGVEDIATGHSSFVEIVERLLGKSGN